MVAPWSVFIGLGGLILSNAAIEFALLGISLAQCLSSLAYGASSGTERYYDWFHEYVSLSTRT